MIHYIKLITWGVFVLSIHNVGYSQNPVAKEIRDVARASTQRAVSFDKVTVIDNGQLTLSAGVGTVMGNFSTTSSTTTSSTSGLFGGCPSDALGENSIVEICIENFRNTTNNSGADLGGTQIAININGSGAVGFLSNGNIFGGGGNLSTSPVSMCFFAFASGNAGPDNTGTSLSSAFLGTSANNLTVGLIASDGFGTGDEYAYDSFSITINDQTCTTEPMPENVCDCSTPRTPFQINVCATSDMGGTTTIIYALVDNTNGSAVLQTNQTGIFTPVSDNSSYTVYAFDVSNAEVMTFTNTIPSTIMTGDPIQAGTLINPNTSMVFNYDLTETTEAFDCGCCSPNTPNFIQNNTTIFRN